jgi:hypothetical protein
MPRQGEKKMTRLRKLTLRQGQLQAVADVFVRALLHNRYEGQTLVNFMEVLFGVKHRHILFAEAVRPFTLEGETIFPGARMLIRHDERRPDQFELELLSDPDVVSKIDARTWNNISYAIALTDKKARCEGAARLFGGVKA